MVNMFNVFVSVFCRCCYGRVNDYVLKHRDDDAVLPVLHLPHHGREAGHGRALHHLVRSEVLVEIWLVEPCKVRAPNQ